VASKRRRSAGDKTRERSVPAVFRDVPITATTVLGHIAPGQKGMMPALLLPAVGVVASIIGALFVRPGEHGGSFEQHRLMSYQPPSPAKGLDLDGPSPFSSA
jgi:hypothetical protein